MTYKKDYKIKWHNGLGKSLKGIIKDVLSKKDEACYYVQREGDSYPYHVVRQSQIIEGKK